MTKEANKILTSISTHIQTFELFPQYAAELLLTCYNT